MGKIPESHVYFLRVYCPIRMERFDLPWDKFWRGLAWVGSPEHEVRGRCFYDCPLCGKAHVISLPDNTGGGTGVPRPERGVNWNGNV